MAGLEEPPRPVDWDVRRLRCFVTLAEELHFGRAAARLSVSGSALTQQINRLENDLDRRLFNRTSRRVALSDAGRALLPLARDALGANDRLSAWVGTSDGQPPAALRIGVTPTAPGTVCRPILARLRDAVDDVPEVAVRLLADHEALDALRAGAVDAIFTREPVVPDGLRETVLFHEARVAVLPRQHPLAAAERIVLSDLDGDMFLPMGAGSREWVDHWLARPRAGGAEPALGPEVRTFDELRQACAAGLGIGIGPATMSRVYAHPQVAYVRIADLAPSRLALCTADRDDPALQIVEDVACAVVSAACRAQQEHAERMSARDRGHTTGIPHRAPATAKRTLSDGTRSSSGPQRLR